MSVPTPERQTNSPEVTKFKTPEERKRTGMRAVNAKLTLEHNKAADKYAPDSKEAKVLAVFNELATLKESFEKDKALEVVEYKKDTNGHDIKPLGKLTTNINGKDEELPDNIRLSEIVGFNKEGEALCRFVNEREEPVNDTSGEQSEVPVPLEYVLQWQVVSEKDTYRKFFPEGEEKLFKAYVGEEKFDENLDPVINKIAKEAKEKGIPVRDEDVAKATEAAEPAAEAEKTTYVEQVLQRRRKEIQVKLAEIEKKAAADNKDPRNDKEYKELKILDLGLRAAEAAKGEYGPIMREKVLKTIKEYDEKNKHADKGIDTLLKGGGGFGAELEGANEALDNLFNEYELSNDQREEFKSAMEEPTKLYKLIDNLIDDEGFDEGFKEIAKELSEGIFGDTDQGEVDNLLSDLINANEEFSSKFNINIKALAEKAGKLGLIALLVAALSPAVAAAMTGAATMKAFGQQR
jgi:hypothetical protein